MVVALQVYPAQEPLEVVEVEALLIPPEGLAIHQILLHHKEIMVLVLYIPEMRVVGVVEKVLLVPLQVQ